ncbi:transmembrane amino acid transporter protein-domain-containing protein [Cunninghamella echinulata]|nr:transmembrane amino acid transporter protein-domain-containing protein [Cunninghamella echinulata]
MKRTVSLPQQQRVPTNTHPSYNTYGTIHGSSNVPPPSLLEEHLNEFDMPNDDPRASYHSSSSSNFRTAIGSFVGSYSRTSALYMADNLLSRPSTLDSAELLQQQEEGEEVRQEDRKLKWDTDSLYSTHTGTGLSIFPALSRYSTIGTIILRDEYHEGSDQTMHHIPQSNFIQSVFNSVNVLVGICILSLPLGIKYAGWVWGSIIFLFCTISTNYSAKILARCLDASPAGSMTYGDMGAAAFGDRGRSFISTIFILELFTLGVAMAILFGDGLETLFALDKNTTSLISFSVLTPMLFLPISKLAYTSIIGVVSSICLVIIIVLDGLSKHVQPGSLWDPMATEIFPSHPYNIPLSFGILMAGYSGHAVFPAIYRDMKDPKQYDRMVDVTYVITFLLYSITATVGYLMFGLDTMQEITKNLASTPGYTKWINQGALYLIVLLPVAKYGLMLNPITLTWEIWLKSQAVIDLWCKDHAWRQFGFFFLGRLFLSAFVIYVASVFPGFDRIVAFLGALFSFGISVIFPLACYQKLYHSTMSTKDSIINWILLLISIILALVGTLWSCLPN